MNAFTRAVEKVVLKMTRTINHDHSGDSGDGGNAIGTGWLDWTPTVTQSGSVSCTITEAKYCIIGKVCHIYADIAITGAGTGANAVIIGGLPAACIPASPIWTGIGTGRVYDTSTSTSYVGMLVSANPVTSLLISIDGAGSFGANPNVALANGDDIRITAMYRVS
jgi:hypothetical protein